MLPQPPDPNRPSSLLACFPFAALAVFPAYLAPGLVAAECEAMGSAVLFLLGAGSAFFLFAQTGTQSLQQRCRELEAELEARTAELKQRADELSVVNAVQEALASAQDMQAIYDLVGDRIRDLFDAQAVVIRTFDHQAKTEQFRYLIEKGERFYLGARPADGFTLYLMDLRDALLIGENFEAFIQRLDESRTDAIAGEQPRSAIFVPMIVGEEIQGNVSLQNVDREHAFSESDLRLLTTLVNSMSVALENARLFAETKRLLAETEQRNAELAVINSVQQGLVAALDMQSIYDLVGDRIRDLFDAQGVIISTVDLSADVEQIQYHIEKGAKSAVPARPLDLLRRRLVESRETILINENFIDAIAAMGIERPEPVPGSTMPKSALYVPMVVGESMRGYVSIQNIDREHAFSHADVRLLSTLANSMSVALENARLFAETKRLLSETEQRNAELGVINSVQEGLVAELDMQAIYDLVGDRIRDLFDAQIAAISTFDLETNQEHIHYVFEDGEKRTFAPRPIDVLRRRLIETRELILLNERLIEASVAMGVEHPEPMPGTRLPKSALFVPLVVGDAVRGYVSLQNLDREHAFTPADVRLLSTLANSMSVALENARLFAETTRLLAETEQRNAELGVINSVQEGLVAELDMQAIYNLVGDRIRDLFDAQIAGISTFDHEADLEYFQYSIEKGHKLHHPPRPIDPIRRRLIDSRQFILINEDLVERLLEMGIERPAPLPGTELPKSMVFVPLVVGETVRGYVTLQNLDREHAFTDADVRLLMTLTNSMSVALENARLFAETRQQATELDTVNRVSRALVSQLEFDTLIKLVGEQIRETFHADIVYLALHDRDSNMLQFPYEYGDYNPPRPFGSGLTEKIITNREPLLINRGIEEVRRQLRAQQIGKVAASYLGVPILVGDTAIGVISVQSTQEENRFDADDLRLLGTIAANVGVAMQNAEAYRKLNEAIEHLKRTQQQLVQSEKMASLGALTAGIAHEIKNPLNFINNFAALSAEMIHEVEDAIASDPEVRAADVQDVLSDLKLNSLKITEHGKRADGIVRSMLEHSRGAKGERRPTDVNAFLEEYVNLAFHGMRAQRAEFNCTLERDYDEQAGMVEMVPQEMGRVLINLLNNAFYAVHEKRLSADGTYQPTVSVSTRREDGHVTIRIRDNGSGIPEEVRQRIFEPFFTTKPTGSGTGLGLSLSYEIVTQGHRGKMSVESEEGAYSVFSVMLPG